jgi:hypothetical protein
MGKKKKSTTNSKSNKKIRISDQVTPLLFLSLL